MALKFIWYLEGDYYLKSPPIEITWDEAKETCNRLESHLLSLSRPKETKDLMNFMKDQNLSSVWIDNQVETRYTWMDETDYCKPFLISD